MKILIGILLMILANSTLLSQQPAPELPKEVSQFDFWVGDWELTWKDPKGNEIIGSNKIERILNDRVIMENFEGPSTGFAGKSFTVYSPRLQKWQQTWVDNGGGYLDFEGGVVDDTMILSREFTINDGKKIKQRMVFYNISENSFDWNWERSDDMGETWKVNWQIHYSRK